MSYKHLRHSFLTFVSAAIALALTVPKHFGMFLVLLAPFIAVALIYNAIAVVVVPENRQRHLTRVVVWILVPLIAGLSQWYWFATTRSTANAVVSAVTEYRSRTGAWPTTLSDVGIKVSTRNFHEPFGYKLRDGEPSLTYLATDTLVDNYFYDFKTQEWLLYH